ANVVETAPPEVSLHGPWQTATVEWRSDTAKCAALTVLLVEPSRVQAMLIRGLLESVGCSRVQHVRTAAEALASVADSAPNVILSAVHLPDRRVGSLPKRFGASRDRNRSASS